MNSLRLSASRIAELHQCSFKLYLKEVEKIPERVHIKTLVGSCLHAILECLFKSKHKHHYDIIVKNNTVYASKYVSRLIKRWQVKYSIPKDLIDEIDDMVLLALTKTDFFFKDCIKRLGPEHEFLLKIDNGEIKGFIDCGGIYKDKIILRDYKTKGSRFTKEELDTNFQSSVYQLYSYKTYGLLGETEFIMVRHKPTKSLPEKHIQRVKAKTVAELKGFEVYLNYLGKIFKNFTYQHACSNFAADDHKRSSFCKYVCSFREKFDYLAHIDHKDKIIKTYFLDEKDKIVLKDGEKLEQRHFKGCVKFN